jgi:hypothetical protein
MCANRQLETGRTKAQQELQAAQREVDMARKRRERLVAVCCSTLVSFKYLKCWNFQSM